jgi:NADH-quinone oxidoreductase subunit F
MEIKVGLATCGISAGGKAVYEKLKEEIAGRKLDVKLKETGCMGMCYREVLVDVIDEEGVRWLYGEVTPERVGRIVEEHVVGRKPVEEWVILDGKGTPRVDDTFLAKQKRIVLRNCGVIDADSIEEYIAIGGYKALEKVIRTMTPAQVIAEVKKSGLRGRGGAGFSTGTKWEFVAKETSTPKYLICNADEGDPGAFMDRSVLESDPHSVLEGMIIGAYAVGASEAYIYCRAEYPLAVVRLKKTIADARAHGFLGENILGSGLAFDVHLKEGAGAFVCGEETALMASVEGKRGMPKFRPPFPAQKGLWGQPTNINNVETWANVPWIILNGGEAFAAMGTEKSKGTKVFAMAGRIKRGGLVEIPMGITIGELVHEIAGGIKEDKGFKAVQMGGPSGGCIPASLSHIPIDYEHITETGAIMGSGGLVVMDETTCMVDVARFFLNFTQNESCGKCTFCRVGTKRMLEMLEKICRGEGMMEDMETLGELAALIKANSLCGLGQTAPNPVLTTLKYFRDEYVAHIRDKKCPAHVCAALVEFKIDPELCNGCQLCVKKCASNAISGEKKKAHVIDQALCTKCQTCMTVCTRGAIYKD